MSEMVFITQVIAGRRITIPKSIGEILGISEGDVVQVKIINVWHKGAAQAARAQEQGVEA